MDGLPVDGCHSDENTTAGSAFKRRRLGTKQEAQNRKRKVREVQGLNERLTKAARTSAMSSTMRRAEAITASVGHGESNLNMLCDNGFARQVDLTHDIKQVHSEANAFYCARCGAYYAGGPLRLLRAPCKGEVPASRRHLHRLLSLGVVPKPHGRIPSHARW